MSSNNAEHGHARGQPTTLGLFSGVSCGLSAAWLVAGDDPRSKLNDREGMKKNKLIAVMAVSAVVAILLGAFALLWWMIKGIVGFDEKMAAAIIAACTTVIVSVATVVYTQQKTKTREIDNSHRPQKVEIYKRFMAKAVVGLLRATKENRIKSPEYQRELEELFFSFTGEVIVWGSPSVIRAYSAFRSAGADPNILLRVDDLLQAMRKDLGNSNWGLTRGELIKLFITDPEKLDEILLPKAMS